MSDENRDDFGDVLRGIAEEVRRSLNRLPDLDVDALARAAGVEPERGREWFEGAIEWVQERAQDVRWTPAAADAPAPHDPAPRPGSAPDGPLDAASGPHPLDVPTDRQGAALAALDSGRWTLEPGTTALTVVGEGPGPSDALGLVRELRVRDWLRADGELTLAGRRALARWLEASR